MDQDQLKQFVDAVIADPELKATITQASSRDEMVAIANAAGFSITTHMLQPLDASRELNDNELEQVNAGSFWDVVDGFGKHCSFDPFVSLINTFGKC